MLNIARSRRVRSTPGLDIAPLIDMVFILLIFFLVNTSFVKETGIEVSRPTASTATLEKKRSVLIAISADNRIFMEQREIDMRAVRANVERALAENPEAAVIVIADKTSATGTAIRVMDGCRMAGAVNVSLAASLPQGS
ncbi:biopolymer transporter ExbD [Desulfobulbus rhabdoformis]|jgi:biopolymer transport protein ExbD|uniref:ExbD/TolR family protein n=1 Tax=Desulfobulbus rhabdoformis TaxID=34032 RepID=UPI001966748B|nr:biopolymer transporter ExbD [Desulfobulbus rhabdoformis]MBM9614828.1 biopolymer transporter ExbD [Desulfobulbus rhabdoformis]